MSNVTEDSEDLCEDEVKLEAGIKLFNDTFGFGAEDTLSFFFSAGDVLRLLNEPEGIGIKVFPALDDDRTQDRIRLTMVLKPFKLPDDFVQKDFHPLRDPAVCCPTPGVPLATGRLQKLQHWIRGITDLL